LPAGDAGTFEAICRAALEQVVARHAVPAAPEADAPEAVLMAALAICRAGRTLFKAGTADTVGAIADATLRVVGTGSADRQAGCAYAGDARLATALLVRHACCAVHLARRELDAGQVHVVALVARAAVDIDLATRRVRALGAGSLPAQPERAEASGEELEHAATRGTGAHQSGEVVKALAVHSRKTLPSPLIDRLTGYGIEDARMYRRIATQSPAAPLAIEPPRSTAVWPPSLSSSTPVRGRVVTMIGPGLPGK